MAQTDWIDEVSFEEHTLELARDRLSFFQDQQIAPRVDVITKI